MVRGIRLGLFAVFDVGRSPLGKGSSAGLKVWVFGFALKPEMSEDNMTITLYAQPYDISAVGFYFTNAEDYAAKAENLRNDYGHPVEEFEIQFIDGEAIDAALARALNLSQANFARFFEFVEDWSDYEKLMVIIAVGECCYEFDDKSDPADFDVDIYHVGSMRELAEQFVEEGLFGEIPEHLANYIDYDAIARDLSVDYSETEIAGQRLIYRCA